MVLFRLALALEKERGLAEVIEEALAARADLACIYSLIVRNKPAFQCLCLELASATGCIGMIARFTGIDGLPHDAVTLVIMHRCNRPVDRDLVEVGTAKAA